MEQQGKNAAKADASQDGISGKTRLSFPPLLRYASPSAALLFKRNASLAPRWGFIYHRAWPFVCCATGGPGPSIGLFFSVSHLTLVLDGRTAATAARLNNVGRQRAFQLVTVSDPGSLDEGEKTCRGTTLAQSLMQVPGMKRKLNRFGATQEGKGMHTAQAAKRGHGHETALRVGPAPAQHIGRILLLALQA